MLEELARVDDGQTDSHSDKRALQPQTYVLRKYEEIIVILYVKGLFFSSSDNNIK